jgi:hypothetical protein
MGILMIVWLVALRFIGKWKPKLFLLGALGPISACIIGKLRPSEHLHTTEHGAGGIGLPSAPGQPHCTPNRVPYFDTRDPVTSRHTHLSPRP